jgi:hypothetical protein
VVAILYKVSFGLKPHPPILNPEPPTSNLRSREEQSPTAFSYNCVLMLSRAIP